jgi:hypothetical protein
MARILPEGRCRSLQDARGLASRRVIPAGAQVQVHPAALRLDLIDLALAVVLAAGLEGEQLRIPRERLEGGQHVSNCHAPSVAAPAQSVSLHILLALASDFLSDAP